MTHRRQTLVQLSDALVESLDRRAARDGVSRSALIRRLLEVGLRDEREDELSRRIAAGYRKSPQSEGRDAWGDLDAWTEANVRRNIGALAVEEDERW